VNWEDLQAKFPELRPVSGVPLLFNIFGCGLIFYGGREEDPDYHTVVKTRYLCVVGIPLLALGSYRMGLSDRGWMILGREPISTTSRWLNIVVLLAAMGGGAWYGVQSLISSDWYVARQQLERADGLVASGQLAEAVGLYEGVAIGRTDYAPRAVARLGELAERPGPRVSPSDSAAVFRAAARLHKAGRWLRPQSDLYNMGMSRVYALAPADPRGAVLLLEAVTPLAPKADDTAVLARELLERVVARTPEDVEMVSRLAVLDEARNQIDRCAKLLEPLRPKLGESEGARILAMVDARAGKVEPALSLLRGYTRPRLERLRKAEAHLKAAVQIGQDRVIEQLKSGKAAGFDYQAARGAGEARANAIVGSYIESQLRDDPEIARAEAAFEAETAVAPVALDLGMLLLQHAQGLPDPEARKRELAEAEQTFLSVQRVAAERPEYQLSLGQVYYWEGKTREGRAEFDKLLEAQKRDARLLLEIANVLREVGSQAEARTLAEDGYRTATDQHLKAKCATLRGLLEPDLQTRIDWMEKGQSGDAFDRAMLSSDRGSQAMEQGDETAAIRHFREAARLYDGLPDHAAKLNNAFGVQQHLARLTGDEEAYERAAAMIERSATLDPGSSIVLTNAARARLDAAVRAVIGPALDLKVLRSSGGLAMLGFLYDDEPAQDAIIRRLSDQPGFARFLALQQKVMLLAPRNPDSYETALGAYEFTEDVAALRVLSRRVAGADLDLSDALRAARERQSGEHDSRDRANWTAAIKREEAVVAHARSAGRQPTLACAIGTLVVYRLGALSLGVASDRDALVALADEAYRGSPSVSSRHVLIEALLERAEARIAKSHPEYAKVVDRTRRSVGSGDRIAALIPVDGPLNRTIADDPDTRLAAELIRIDAEKRPKGAGAFDWAMLRVFDPEAASRVARAYAANEVDRLAREVRGQIDPYSSHAALVAYWTHTMAGRKSDADGVVRAYTARGLPLPIGAQ
jgi:tetratricopeptide (TPR) repeat protein